MVKLIMSKNKTLIIAGLVFFFIVFGIYLSWGWDMAHENSEVSDYEVESIDNEKSFPDESAYCVDSQGDPTDEESCTTLGLADRECGPDEECVSTCGFGCVNEKLMNGEKIDCEAVPAYQCECVKNYCQIKQ